MCNGGDGKVYEYKGAGMQLAVRRTGLRRINGIAEDADGTLYESDEDCGGYGPAYVNVFRANESRPWARLNTGLATDLFPWP